jgi:rfaE bifunctional protein kinase chain/domain/rfaE bifunctional protein nucleotidyltransferase chain/domain
MSGTEDANKRSSAPKVVSLDELAQAVSEAKKNGQSIVHCHGVFDLVHPGHIRHLDVASKLGDILIVTITSDRYVNKGPGRPVFTAHLRAETLAALACVQYVYINDATTSVEIIDIIKPNVYAKGNDYQDQDADITGMIKEERSKVEAGGGKIHFTNEMSMSSSELLNQHFDVYPPDTRDWLTKIQQKYSVKEIIDSIDNMRDKKVLVIGEAIIDEYYFCEGLGKSAKDPILAFKFASKETYIGGSLSVANHLAGLCDKVGIVSLVGDKDSRIDFIRDHLHPSISFYPFGREGAPTIHKRRYIDSHTGSKLFELYTLEDTLLDEKSEQKLLDVLAEAIGDYDVVVVSDYGHGMMTSKVIDFIIENSAYLAVNTQANAGNRGFNTISKYHKADYVCLNGGEVHLEMRMRQGSFQDMVLELSEKMDCPNFTVTLGKSGTLHYNKESGFVEAPALAIRIADRVGAGDAVLSVTSPLVAGNTPWEITALLANLAGAEVVAELGTSITVDRTTLVKHVETILK